MDAIIAGAAADLLSEILQNVSGVVRRRLNKDPVHKALQAAITEALEAALESYEPDSGLRSHYESFFGDVFKNEAVVAELSQLPIPAQTSRSTSMPSSPSWNMAGLDPGTLPDFDLNKFLRVFAGAFYTAIGQQEALKGVLDLKLLGEVVVGVSHVAQWSERGAKASERTADGVERLAVEG